MTCVNWRSCWAPNSRTGRGSGPGRPPDGPPGGHAQLIVVLDGGRVPPGCQLAMGDAHGVTVLDLQSLLRRPDADHAQPVLRLRVAREEMMTVAVARAEERRV